MLLLDVPTHEDDEEEDIGEVFGDENCGAHVDFEALVFETARCVEREPCWIDS